MEPRLEAEIRIRRDDALKGARYPQRTSRAVGDRNTGMRIRIAHAAEAMSGALATLARSLRNGETG